MRMRKKKNGSQRLARLDALMLHPTAAEQLDTDGLFDEIQPLVLEIGCGKGDFVCGMAQAHPDWNFIAVERIPDIILAAMEKVEHLKLRNIRFINCNAQELTSYFKPSTFFRLYLNFSDPWPKKGHAKRRLTHSGFLSDYRQLLQADGAVMLKTDNRALFLFSLEQFESSGFRLTEVTVDLHRSMYQANNVETEYERNFSAQGMPIYHLAAFPETP